VGICIPLFLFIVIVVVLGFYNFKKKKQTSFFKINLNNMSNVVSSPEITFAPQAGTSTKHIWRVFWILLGITAIELGLGLIMYAYFPESGFAKNLIKGIIIILSLAKAFYITASFMHLGDEVKNMIMTIVVPLLLFVWFIIAFLYEGSSWKQLRNTNAGSTKDETKIEKVEKPAAKPGAEK
jgi:cytochrome c oxidase subunit IV